MLWIILVVAVLVLGSVALGAYLVAARKLYSKDKEVVAHQHSEAPSGDRRTPGGTTPGE